MHRGLPGETDKKSREALQKLKAATDAQRRQSIRTAPLSVEVINVEISEVEK